LHSRRLVGQIFKTPNTPHFFTTRIFSFHKSMVILAQTKTSSIREVAHNNIGKCWAQKAAGHVGCRTERTTLAEAPPPATLKNRGRKRPDRKGRQSNDFGNDGGSGFDEGRKKSGGVYDNANYAFLERLCQQL